MAMSPCRAPGISDGIDSPSAVPGSACVQAGMCWADCITHIRSKGKRERERETKRNMPEKKRRREI